ncbi:MAG: hypothetical protein ABIQ86_01110 [Steroidobacteraceae bacterium]
MKQVLPCLAAIVGMSYGIAWPADSVTGKAPERQIIAERNFGDVSFVIGAGTSMKWLEMYVDGRLVAAFRDFDVEAVVA